MKHSLAVLFICSALAWAAAADAPDYNLNVHVSSSRMVLEGNFSAYQQYLDVAIDGKKYELKSVALPMCCSCPETTRRES